MSELSSSEKGQGKSAGEIRQEDMQAWIFVIQNDLYKLETKSIKTLRMKFGKGRFKRLK